MTDVVFDFDAQKVTSQGLEVKYSFEEYPRSFQCPVTSAWRLVRTEVYKYRQRISLLTASWPWADRELPV